MPVQRKIEPQRRSALYLAQRLALLGFQPEDSFESVAQALVEAGPALRRELESQGLDGPRLLVDLFESGLEGYGGRRKLGAYYTPPQLVEAILDRLPLDGIILDPAAGAGAFVLALVRRLGAAGLGRIHACDINPKALDACALVLKAELGPSWNKEVERWRKEQAHCEDFLRDPPAYPLPDLILGNPPYGIDKSPELAELFPLLQGELDLYACFMLQALTRVRAASPGRGEGGRVALLVPDTFLNNTRARTLRQLLAEHRIHRIIDFGKPFSSARDTRVQVAVVERKKAEGAVLVESLREARLLPMKGTHSKSLRQSVREGWSLYRTPAEHDICEKMVALGTPLGEIFQVVYGLRTGNNAACIRSDRGEDRGPTPPAGEGLALVSGGDLVAYDRHWRPKYLYPPPEHQERIARLVKRQHGHWRLGVQRVRTNSSATWRRWLEVAPLGPDEIGLDSLTLISDSESTQAMSPRLLALLGVLNSSILNRWYQLSFTDVNVKPSHLRLLPVPSLSAELGEMVSQRLSAAGDLKLERKIDRLVAEAFGLRNAEIATLEEGFWGSGC